jgi:hypothetical protein
MNTIFADIYSPLVSIKNSQSWLWGFIGGGLLLGLTSKGTEQTIGFGAAAYGAGFVLWNLMGSGSGGI